MLTLEIIASTLVADSGVWNTDNCTSIQNDAVAPLDAVIVAHAILLTDLLLHARTEELRLVVMARNSSYFPIR
jgi:hypothetical protein